MAHTLDVLSKANMVHSDLKPENILVNIDEKTKKFSEVNFYFLKGPPPFFLIFLLGKSNRFWKLFPIK